MEKINAIVVDDESAAREVLEELLLQNCPAIKVVDQCEDVLSAVESIREHKPDVIFLDVQMPNYAGYEIVDLIDKIDFEIVFVTAYDNYAIKAFELNAIDYLVKPINRQKLTRVVDKLTKRLHEKDAFLKYNRLMASFNDSKSETIVISEHDKKRVISTDSIIAIEAKGAYSQLYLKEEKELLVSKNLKHFERLLAENQRFFRSHKSWIFNLDCLISFNKNKREIELSGGISCKLSKYRIKEFEKLNSNF